MWNQTLTLVLAFGFYTAGIAFAQTAAPNPTQQPSVTVADGQTPLFRITVVGRTTPAINYRPRSGDTRIDFAGTAVDATGAWQGHRVRGTGLHPG